jgi:hypothetical protein
MTTDPSFASNNQGNNNCTRENYKSAMISSSRLLNIALLLFSPLSGAFIIQSPLQHFDYTRPTSRLRNAYDDWRSDAVAPVMPLDEDNVKSRLQDLIESDYGKTMFGRLAVVMHDSRVQSAAMGLFSIDCRQHEAPVLFVWHGAAETSKQTSHQARDRLFVLTFGRCFARMLLISLNDSTVSRYSPRVKRLV